MNASLITLDLESNTPSDFCVRGTGINFKSRSVQDMKNEVFEFIKKTYDIPGDDIVFVNLTF